MIDPRSIDQDALEANPLIIWDGSFDGPAYRVVMVPSDEDPAPRLVIEERRTDAMGQARWLDVVGAEDRAAVLEVALMSVAATGQPLNVPAVAACSLYLSVRKPDETRPKVYAADEAPPVGEVLAYKVRRGGLVVEEEVLDKPVRYDEGSRFEIDGGLIVHDPVDTDTEPPAFDAYQDGQAAALEGQPRLIPAGLSKVEGIRWLAGYESGQPGDGGHVRWTRLRDGHVDGSDTPVIASEGLVLIAASLDGREIRLQNVEVRAGFVIRVRNRSLYIGESPLFCFDDHVPGGEL